MKKDVEKTGCPRCDFFLLVVTFWRVERPIDKHGTSHHIFLRNESPIPAVVTDIAIVTHGEVAVGRNYDVISLYILAQRKLPIIGQLIIVRGSNRREIYTIGIIKIGRRVRIHIVLLELLTIAIDDTIP